MSKKPEPPQNPITVDLSEDTLTALRELLSPIRQHIDESHALLLYAILMKAHQSRTEEAEVDKLPAATQPYLLEITGFKQDRLSRMLEPLREAGYVVAAGIHSLSARQQIDNAMLCYEVNTKTVITNRATAALLLTLLDLSTKSQGGSVPLTELIGTLKSLAPEDTHTTLVGDEHYYGKINELVDSDYLERVAADLFRPRLRLYLERRYLILLNEHPSEAKIREYFRNSLHGKPKKIGSS